MRDVAYEYLKGKILNCEILPGQEISEKRVLDALGTGRTPVREAIITLQKEGLVEVFPRKGTCATTITIADATELYQLRKLIEPTVAIQFREQLDPGKLMKFDESFLEICDRIGNDSDIEFYELDIKFHSYIVESANNSRLKRIFDDIMLSVYRLGIFNTIQNQHNPKQSTYNQHHRIIQAILMEDDDEIQKALVSHINYSRMSSLKTLSTVQNTSERKSAEKNHDHLSNDDHDYNRL